MPRSTSVIVTKKDLVTHEVKVVDKEDVTMTFRRIIDGRWEQWVLQRNRWESFRYPMAEALLDKIAEV